MLSSLYLSLTDDCNFRCPYCYHPRRQAEMDGKLLEEVIRLAAPKLRRGASVVFCGGEPLLAYPLIRQTVERIRRHHREKAIRYALTSNGSLLDAPVLAFFARHRFRLLLSYDGEAQERRMPGSRAGLERLLEALPGYPGLEWRVNATFTPATVPLLASSLRSMVGRKVPAVLVSLAADQEWNQASLAELQRQLRTLVDFLAGHYRRTGELPVPEFAPGAEPFRFVCRAGTDRLAVDSAGRVWGCHLFAEAHRRRPREWLEEFSFGSVAEAFQNNRTRRRALACYGDLRQDLFHSPDRPCWACPDLDACGICPAANLIGGSPVPERVPRTSCRLQKISIAARRRFSELAGA